MGRVVKPAAQKMEEDEKLEHPTFFEFMTAIAFLHFEEKKVDLSNYGNRFGWSVGLDQCG